MRKKLYDSLGVLKEELMKNHIDICEVRKASEAKFYINQFNKPCIMASDAHNLEDIGRNFAWIKAEPSFDGLRQIVFEPKSRVKLQETEPEEKSDYLCIKSLKIDSKTFGKQEIPFNKGLNTIIGGRSSGKSVLLGCIAKLCGYNENIKRNNNDYDDFISDISKEMSVEWADGNNDGVRKIDYFPQNYISEIARKPDEINKIINMLFADDKDKSNALKRLNTDISSLKSSIRNKLDEYFSIKNEVESSNAELQKLGNKPGLEKEIKDIDDKLADMTLTLSMSNDEKGKYEEYQAKIEQYENKVLLLEANLEKLQELQVFEQHNELFASPRLIEYINYNVDDDIALRLSNTYDEIVAQANKKWQDSVIEIVKEQTEALQAAKKEQNEILGNVEYKNLQEKIKEHKAYTDLLNKSKQQKARLDKIKQQEDKKKDLEKKALDLMSKLVIEYKEFYSKKVEFCSTVQMVQDDLIIEPVVAFKSVLYNEFCDRYFNNIMKNSQEVKEYKFKDIDNFTDHISSMITNLLKDVYKLKKGVQSRQVIEELLTTSLFEVQYDIQYQNDSLNEMSEGKKAFVILRLLLDFSKNDCPILIDQPEDDLDNRAIYEELVAYLRKKKLDRQIILVTHNPNIVVGADAEEVIVANQQGTNSTNPDNAKFAYYTGALEDTFIDESQKEVLLSKGIREHVCEILEGGTTAFKLREQKYQFKLR